MKHRLRPSPMACLALTGFVAAVFLVSGASVPDAVAEEGIPTVIIQQNARPGDPFVVYLASESPIEDCVVRLLDPDGKELLKAGAFPYPAYKYVKTFAAVLGTWSTQKPGMLSVEIRWKQSGSLKMTTQVLALRERIYPSFDLKATKSMTTLRYAADPQKEKESNILYALLNGSDPTAMYLDAPFIVPVANPRVTTEYGERIRYLYTDGTITQNAHAGIDFGAATGTPVQAAGRGRVVMAVSRIMTGNTVIIEHLPGVFSQYYHLDAMTVSEGQVVARGQQIGTVGTTGFSTGSHLHWDLRVHYVSVDPMVFVSAAPLDKDLVYRQLSRTPIEGR